MKCGGISQNPPTPPLTASNAGGDCARMLSRRASHGLLQNACG